MSIPGSASPLFFTAAADAAAAGPIKSVRFNSDDSPYLNRTPSSAGNRKTFTLSGWIKRSSFGVQRGVFSTYAGTHPTTALVFSANDEFWFFDYNSSYNFQLITSAVFRDPSAWLHFVIAVDTTQATASNRVKIYINGEQVTDFGTSTYPSQDFELDWNSATEHNIGKHSRNFNGYFADFYFIDGQAKEATDFGAFDDNGVWQAAAYSGTFGTNGFHLFDFANESGIGNDSSGNDNDFTVNNLSAVGADTVASVDSKTGGTYTDQQLLDSFWKDPTGGITYFSPTGLTAVVFNLSPALEVSDFKFVNGGGSGTIKFIANEGESDETSASQAVSSSTATYDISSFDNLAISTLKVYIDDNSYPQPYGFYNGSARITGVVNGSLIDVLRDVPTNGDSSDDTGAGGEVSGNYCTLNPLVKTTGRDPTLTNGNLDFGADTNSNFTNSVGTIAVSSGKWYVEYTIGTNVGSSNGLGFINSESLASAGGSYGIGQASDGWLRTTSVVYNNSSSVVSSLTTISSGDVVMLALDIDNGKAWWGLNGTFENSGDPGAGSNAMVTFTPGGKSFVAGISAYHASVVASGVINFGARSFAYTAPSGFKALNTASLPTPTVADGSTVFDVKLYTGNASTQSVSLNFGPDLLWLKSRSAAKLHALCDSVRGDGKLLYSDSTLAEQDIGATVVDLTSSGFNLGYNGGFTAVSHNHDEESLVAWAWDAGSSTVSNTDGSITSSVRANQTAGFSIVSFTGTNANGTVGHGLNAKPSFYIIKNRDTASNWFAFTDLIDGSNDYLYLNTTGVKNDAGLNYANVATSSVFYMGVESGGLNTSGDEHIAYCFTSVANYSQFGVYEGNGSADGLFVHTNFQPALVIYKNADTAYGWQIYDSTRDPDNVCDTRLSPSTSNAEDTTTGLDMLSNGFKIRTSHARTNNSGDTFVYFAFASNPFSSNGGLAR